VQPERRRRRLSPAFIDEADRTIFQVFLVAANIRIRDARRRGRGFRYIQN
jgi:hypothetical protein